MKHIGWLAGCAAVAASGSALALGSLASVSVVDRETGTVLPVHYYRGDYWVAGTPGARYAIRIRNCDGGRLLAVTSVDGVNVLTGKTASWRQSGYVFDPGEEYQIAGWRKSQTEVAAFTFTDAADSYAERTGRPASVGVIGIAVFRERAVVAAEAASPPASAAGAPSPSTAATSPLRGHMQSQTIPFIPAPAPKLGTGHGAREYSEVVDTDFQRLQSEPNEVIRIRYDSFEHLVSLGVIAAPGKAPGTPDPFPGSPQRQFVPDPPG
jgi:hypothetical protein